MPESTRRQIGKYQIQAELGRGGFGVVYRAYDPTLRRSVAVKVLTALGDNQLLTRFKNEAAAAGNLGHKNIVTIYDYGDDDGLPYIVMELLEGEDLNQIIASQKPMPLLQKVSIMVQVADGLRCAHRAGVVHRDVKPGNIRLLPDGTVKLMDFGIARLVAGPAVTRLTRQGHVIGTLYYMAPEQVLGEEVDSLSDIFAYGSTYYELLTGRHPFQGSDLRAVFHKITAEDPEPIRNLVPDCPEALERIVNRTLQKDRELRYQSLRDVQLDTEPILIELRQERAESLAAEAKRLYGAGQLENAQTVLGEVFDLDPSNRESRHLYETIQKELLGRLIRPKIEALVKKAEEAISARRFDEAIESFEAARRLDKDSRELAERVEQARQLLQTSREIARLIADARRAFSKQNLEGTLEILPGILERDPGNPEAQQLLSEVRAALALREKERDYQEKVQRAKDLLQANNFDESARLLEDVDPEFRAREEVRSLAAQIRSRKDFFERQQRLKQEIAAVKDLLAGEQFEAAVKRAESLINKFPEEVEPTKLFILAHRELAAYRKAQALETLLNELDRLVKSGHFERALSLISQSLRTYPSEPRLLDAQGRIEAEWARHKRGAAIRRLMEDGARHLARNEIEKAVQVLEGGVQQYPDEPEIAKSLASAREALATKLREEAIGNLCRQAQAQLNGREYQKALEAIEHGLATYGSDERLTGMRDRIISARIQWEQAEAVRAIVERSRKLVAQNDFQAALERLETGLRQFPEERQLVDALEAAREALAIRQREEAIEALCSQAQGQVDRREYQQALEAIERGLAEYGNDRRLAGMREQVLSSKAKWEREQAVRQAVEDSRKFIEAGDFNGAIWVLESALKRYSADPELTRAMTEVRNAWAVKRRADAIEAVCAQALDQVEKREFQRALKTIDRGVADYGGDPRLSETHDKILSAQAEWERTEAIRRIIEDANSRLAKGEPEFATQALDSALKRYPGEPQLKELMTAAQAALAAKQRKQAIETLCQQAQAQLEARAYQNALDLLDRGLAAHGPDRLLKDLRDAVVSAKGEFERAAAIRKAVEESRKHVAQREFDKAFSLLDSVLSQYPGEPELAQAMDGARAELAFRLREEAIEGVCRQAQEQLDKNEFQHALELLDAASKEHGRDRRLAEMRERVLSAKAKWERSEAVRQAVEDSKTRVAQQDFNGAIVLLESALKRYPANPELAGALESAREALAAKRRDEAIEAACREAQEQVERREFPRALKTIDRGQLDHGSDPRFTAAREKVLAAKADWERVEAVRHVIDDARKRLAQGKPATAVELLEAALKRYPEDPHLIEALEFAQTALASFRREEAIETLCRQAQQYLQSHEFHQALDAIDRGLGEYGGDQRLSDLRAAVLSGKVDWERAQALLLLVHDAQQRIADEQPESALELLESARSQYRDEPLFQETLTSAREAIAAKQRRQAMDDACRSSQALLDQREYRRALDLLDDAASVPGEDLQLAAMREKILSAKAEWERSQEIGRVLDNWRKQVSENKLEEALELLNAALIGYPGEPELLKALAETRQAFENSQRETVVAELCRETTAFLGTQDFSAALAILDQGLKAYGSERRLAELRDTVLSAQADWERLGAVRGAADEAGRLVAQAEPEKAVHLLEKALARFSGEPVLLDALAAAHEAAQASRRESIERIYAEARGHLQRGDFDAALQQVESVLDKSPDDARFLELRETIAVAKTQREEQRISQQVKFAVHSAEILTEQGRREEAIALLERALNEHPANSELVSAIVSAIDAVGAAGTTAIDKICRSARQHVLTGEFDLAFQTLEQALRPKADERSAAVQTPLKSRNEPAARPMLSSQSRPSTSVQEESAEHALFEDIPVASAQRNESSLLLEHGTGPPVSPPPSLIPTVIQGAFRNWKLIGLTAGLLLLGSIFLIRLLRVPKVATLSVRSSPAGATIRVNTQTCSTPTCEFHLPPGQYSIQVSADGYRAVTQSISLGQGIATSPVVITLEPLSPVLRCTANFTDGDVTLDSRRVGALQDGQFTVDRLTPGRHTLQVSGKQGAALVSFESDYARLPSFNQISGKDTDLIALGTFGNSAVIACSGCSGIVNIDERRAGELKNGTLTVSDVKPGTHRVKLSGGTEASLVFSTAGAPGINLAVNSNRNVGALIVETGQDNVAVFLDGRKYPRLTSNGRLLIPAGATEHTIRVAKAGYHAEPPEMRVQLAKGDQFQALFQLTPEPARLLISNQLPGATVSIDGSRAGTVGPDGAFSVQVPAGDHRIEFSKDGYLPADVRRSFEPGQRIIIGRSDAPLVAKAANPPPAQVAQPPKPDPNAAEQDDWQRIAGTQTMAQLENFLRNHPAGIHRDEAQARLKELRQQQANAEREEAWNSVDKNNEADLQQFLSKYGEGSHGQEAQTMIEAIRKKQTDDVAIAQQTSDLKAIRNTLSQFEAAYNRRDLVALQRLWNGMPKSIVETYRGQFRDAKALAFQLKPEGSFSLAGDSATATCIRTLDFTARNGQHPPESNERVRVTLDRAGSQWVIRAITPF